MDKQLVFKGRIVQLTVEKVTLPNGKQAEMEIVGHPGGAAAVAIDAQQRICMLRQYRPVFRDWLWELPAGKLDPGEEPLATAKRELIEEAGIEAARWTSLGHMFPSPGVFGETLHLFLAEDLTSVPSANEEHELLEVHWVTLPEALARAAAGDINDAKTVVGLFRAVNALKDVLKRKGAADRAAG